MNKHVAAIIPFVFVIIWHGPNKTNTVWASLNILEFIIEIFGHCLCATSGYNNWVKRHISPTMERRLIAAANVPVIMLSLFSNFMFFTDWYTATFLIRQFLNGRYYTTLQKNINPLF